MSYDHWAADHRSGTGTETADHTVDSSDLMAALLVVALAAFCIWFGFVLGVNSDRAMAVRAGVARWEPVGSDGEVEFRYLAPAAAPAIGAHP